MVLRTALCPLVCPLIALLQGESANNYVAQRAAKKGTPAKELPPLPKLHSAQRDPLFCLCGAPACKDEDGQFSCYDSLHLNLFKVYDNLFLPKKRATINIGCASKRF